MLTLSPSDARYVLSKIHEFESLELGLEDTKRIVHKHQCIQSDPIDVAGRNADLTLQSRVSNYKEGYLYDILYNSRHAFEYYCKAFSIQPMETLKSFLIFS